MHYVEKYVDRTVTCEENMLQVDENCRQSYTVSCDLYSHIEGGLACMSITPVCCLTISNVRYIEQTVQYHVMLCAGGASCHW